MTLDITFEDGRHTTIENVLYMREHDYQSYGKRMIVQSTGDRERIINLYEAEHAALSMRGDNDA